MDFLTDGLTLKKPINTAVVYGGGLFVLGLILGSRSES